MSIWHLVLSKVKRKDVLRLGSVRFLCSSPLWWRAGTRDLLHVIFIQLSCPWGVIWMEIYIQGSSCFPIPCPIVQLSKCPFDHFIVGKNSYLTCRWMIFIWKSHNDLIKMTVMNEISFVCVLGDEKKSKLLFSIHRTKPLLSIRGNYFPFSYYFMQFMYIQGRLMVINWICMSACVCV